MAVLTESKDPLAYWRKLKQRLKEEGNQTVTNCHGLKYGVQFATLTDVIYKVWAGKTAYGNCSVF